jgi:hypothetical protein
MPTRLGQIFITKFKKGGSRQKTLQLAYKLCRHWIQHNALALLLHFAQKRQAAPVSVMTDLRFGNFFLYRRHPSSGACHA